MIQMRFPTIKLTSYSIALFIFSVVVASCNREDDDEIMSYLLETLNVEVMSEIELPEFDAPAHYSYLPDRSVEDIINARSWNYEILLPPSFNEEGENDFPVLFLLHGYNSKCKIWEKSFNITGMIDYCHEYFSLPEIIVVMPDAGNTYYLDNHQGEVKYEKFFIEEFIPFIFSEYKIRESKCMISGFSMGGYGSARYAVTYPGMFSFCYGTATPLDGKGNMATVPAIFDASTFSMNKDYPYFIFDVGMADSFLYSNVDAHKFLLQENVPHELIVRDGGHNSQFWKESLYLMFQRLSRFIREGF